MKDVLKKAVDLSRKIPLKPNITPRYVKLSASEPFDMKTVPIKIKINVINFLINKEIFFHILNKTSFSNVKINTKYIAATNLFKLPPKNQA